jgi:hypothetical protein
MKIIITEEAIHKHLKLTPAMDMGHMNQKRQHIRSTSKIVEVTSDLEDVSVTPVGTGEKTNLVYAVVIDQGQLYTDLTGRFPVRSSKGNWYIMIIYSYDCNYIKPVAMHSISASEWVRAFGEVCQELTSRGFKPKLQTMDNEASASLKNYFTEQDMTYQLVPLHCHRRNAAERAIRTFKEHFVAGLASVDPDFPMHMGDRLLPQAEMSFNLLRTSRLYPQLSAAAHLHGLLDYNKTAFAPPGCKVIAHVKPSQRRTWAPHGHPGYSLGPAMHHYRCQNVYITSTYSERIVDTLNFFPHNSPMPQLSSTDRVLMAAQDMTDALKHPHLDVPFATIGDETIMNLTKLATIFKNKFQKPLAPEAQSSPVKAAENKRPAALTQQALTSPVRPMYQTRSQTINPILPAHVIQYPNSSLPPRVVTPTPRSAAPPRVPARARNLSPGTCPKETS